MRLNIYGEELTSRMELTSKTVNQELFVGVRFYIKSHPDLHHSDSDNDESAVTFWVPWTKEKGNDYQLVYNMFAEACNMLHKIMEGQKEKVAS